MLQITVPANELWDESKQEYIYTKEQTLRFEHSLISLSKWEARWQKPFLSKGSKTLEETLDYIRCMTLTQNVDPNVYLCLSNDNIMQIQAYIEDGMTATTFGNSEHGGNSREQVTSELIYYWMIAFNIPFECQKWHLNRLMTLIKICNIKNKSPKKISRREIMSRNAALNSARRKHLNSRG